eukprot:scaffold14907_cov60-Phaeocystis_antarctica.AAC.2
MRVVLDGELLLDLQVAVVERLQKRVGRNLAALIKGRRRLVGVRFRRPITFCTSASSAQVAKGLSRSSAIAKTSAISKPNSGSVTFVGVAVVPAGVVISMPSQLDCGASSRGRAPRSSRRDTGTGRACHCSTRSSHTWIDR